MADNLTNVESLLLGESTGTKTVGGGGVWYKLTLANQTAVKFDINKESGQQLGIEIFNSNTLNLLLSSYNDYDSDISAVLDVGTYYILLRSMDDFGNISSGSLTVRNNQIIINSSTGEVSVDHSCGTWYSFKIGSMSSVGV